MDFKQRLEEGNYIGRLNKRDGRSGKKKRIEEGDGTRRLKMHGD